MSKFAKTAIAAAMVMGAVVSSSAFAAGNNGTARFYGTIEDSPCSIVPDDHKLEVDMGDIGAAKLTGRWHYHTERFPDPFTGLRVYH